tara:strand:- start:1124 stop:1972 length:849 start_codon:yes stop_codon:yes gene_type:complete
VKKFIGAILFSIVLSLSCSAALAENLLQSIEKKHKEMLYPTVLVSLERGAGSGTVIFSRAVEKTITSLVLTNYHVVAKYVSVEKEWDSSKEKKVDVERKRPVSVEVFEYNNYSELIGTIGREADIVAYDEKRDLALLKITDTERLMPYVAKLYPENKDTGPWIFSNVFAVGAGLGKPPFPTAGFLAGFSKDINGNPLWLASAPIIFGNSGGSLFVYSQRGQYELIGVPSMVSSYGWDSAIVPHMAWARPITEIRLFLRKNGFGYVLGDVEEKEKKETKDASE